MDRTLRRLQRATQATDLPSLLRLLSARRRAAQAGRRPKDGHLVAGPLLAQSLRAALESTGQREVELLRAHGVAETRIERWIHRLRALMRGDPVAWVWVVRWADLLTAFAVEDLACAAELRRHPQRGLGST